MLLARGTPDLLELLQKTFQAALNASSSLSEDMRSLVNAVWDLLGRVIHESGSKAGSTSVSPSTALQSPQLPDPSYIRRLPPCCWHPL